MEKAQNPKIEPEQFGGVSEPSEEDVRELESVLSNADDIVELRGKSVKIGWIRRGTLRKISSVMNDKSVSEDKITCKCAAAAVLNSYWKIKFFWGLLWRYYYYIKQYSDSELTPILALVKKKVPALEYYVATILLTEVKDTTMAMIRQEAEAIRAAQITAQAGKSASARRGSQNPSESAESR
ncbi:MAG: hypothetical protein LIP02_09605 [Bacteroidales bacterium]|nr:hypothetical protein [Bacteroidales bacterium]